MFYGSYYFDGKKHAAIYDSWDLFHRDTFNPLCEEITIIPFESHGKSYTDRRESVRETAVTWSNCEAWPLSWCEVQTVADWFYRMGKRYGLLTEFRENGLC